MNNNNWIRDFERKQFEEQMVNESRRQNDLLNLQIANQERQRKKEEEKSYKDKIDHLRLALAQASGSRQQEQIQILLDEAKADYESYLERKRKSEKINRIISIILLFIMIPLFFWMFREIFGDHSYSQKNGASTDQTTLKASEEDENALEVSSQSVVPSSSDGTGSTVSEPVSTSSSTELPAPYADTRHTSPHEFTVDVTVTDLNIHQAPSLSASVVRIIPQGTYTIVQTSQSGGQYWGKLKSGEGWIILDMITFGEAEQTGINQLDLTTEQVQKWVRASFLRRVSKRNKIYAEELKNVPVEVKKEIDGLVYAKVLLSESVLADLAQSQPQFYPREAEYRINQDGELERLEPDLKGEDGQSSAISYYWEYDSDSYFESW